MFDLETFGTAKNSVIIQVAAIQFNHDFTIVNTFNDLVDPQSCLDAGLSIDLSTVLWWMEQSEEAKRSVILPKKRSHLKDVLWNLHRWIPKETKAWGNGASFDLSILDSAYRACKIPLPWKHWDERCYRTINALVDKKDPCRPPRVGVYHNALDDCRTQLQQLEYVCKKMNIPLV
jgi:hypothetical protein